MATYTLTQLQALKDALASGELTVSYEGKTVTYRSVDELRKAIVTVEGELAEAGQITAKPRRSFAVFSRD